MSDQFLGEIRMFAGNFAPRGWAFCQGQIMAISTNSALFSILGTTYGGNGSSTFALPDLRGRVPTGTGPGPGLPLTTLGEIAGTPSVTLNINQLPQHNHTAAFTGAATSVATNLSIGTTHAAAIANPTNGSTTYLTAADATYGGDPVPITGLYSSTAPVAGSTATLAGGSVNVTPQGTIAVGFAGSSAAVPITQPYLGINFIIAVEGMFPSRN